MKKEQLYTAPFSLSKKSDFYFVLRATARIKSHLRSNFIKTGGVVPTTLSCRYAAIHLVYLGFYTREEKMCPEDAVFRQPQRSSYILLLFAYKITPSVR